MSSSGRPDPRINTVTACHLPFFFFLSVTEKTAPSKWYTIITFLPTRCLSLIPYNLCTPSHLLWVLEWQEQRGRESQEAAKGKPSRHKHLPVPCFHCSCGVMLLHPVCFCMCVIGGGLGFSDLQSLLSPFVCHCVVVLNVSRATIAQEV